MNLAEEMVLRRAFLQQGSLLGQQQEELAVSRHAYSEIFFQLNHLVERLDQLQASPSAAQAVPPTLGHEGAVPRRIEPRLNLPATYSGEPTHVSHFCPNAQLGIKVALALSLLQQGEQSVFCYSIEFHTLATSCGWNEKAFWDHFSHGLAEHVKDEIYSLDLPSGLDGLIELTIWVNNWIALHSRHRRGGIPNEHVTGA